MSRDWSKILTEQAKRFPDKIAFSRSGGAQVTYAQLSMLALKTASMIKGALAERGPAAPSATEPRATEPCASAPSAAEPCCELGRPVVITVARDVLPIVGIFGAIAADTWYVPIDCSLPADRAKLLLDICDPELIILATPDDPFPDTDIPKLRLSAAELAGGGAELPRELAPIEAGPAGQKPAPERCVPAGGELAGKIPATEVCVADETELATVLADEEPARKPLFGIFTSGSTGIPKLVVKDSTGITDFICEYCRVFGFTEEERFGNQIPFYFDASTKDIFATVYLGATCVILPQNVFSFPSLLVGTLESERITAFVCVPSVMGTVAQYGALEAVRPSQLANVLFVGERIDVKHLRYWRDNLPGTRFVNLYGSTEVAGNSCYYIVEGEPSADEVLPIGHPFSTSRVVLMTPDGEISREGEICVGGSGLALGYYRDEEKTRAVFRYSESAGQVLCHSGDYGRMTADGCIVCLARSDSQIKHMGHRVELGEIEAVVGALEYIRECCCLWNSEAGTMKLCYSCPQEYAPQLKKELRKKLPRYMIPEELVWSEELPHNRNGKIDREKLK